MGFQSLQNIMLWALLGRLIAKGIRAHGIWDLRILDLEELFEQSHANLDFNTGIYKLTSIIGLLKYIYIHNVQCIDSII